MEHLPDELVIHIMKFLNPSDLMNVLEASPRCAAVFSSSSTHLSKFTLNVSNENCNRIYQSRVFKSIPIKKVSVSFDYTTKFEKCVKILKSYENFLEDLELKNLTLVNFAEFHKLFERFSVISSIKFRNCKIPNCDSVTLPAMPRLKSVTIDECDSGCIKIFKYNESIEKIEIRSNSSKWNGFCHDSFNETVRTLPNFKHLILKGIGTEGYFDGDYFPYKIKKLEASSITFRWYVGVKTARKTFLESQKGHLKELKIDKLPYDFDGGKVIRFIIDHMGLDNFYYGNIPLILNGEKQKVKEFEATEVQISSIFEMFFQFPSIQYFRLRLSNEDIASDEIERIIDPKTDLFKNLKVFELVDESGIRGLFGVFLGFFRNLKFIEKLIFRTTDRNINVILEECLSEMINLSELHLENDAPRENERIKIINDYAPSLKKLTINDRSIQCNS